MTEQELLNKKKEIEISKSKLQKLAGKEELLLKKLKMDWKCSTLMEAKEKLKTMKAKINKLNEEIEKGTEGLEKTYFMED